MQSRNIKKFPYWFLCWNHKLPTLQLCMDLRKAESNGSFGEDACQAATNSHSPRAAADTYVPACSTYGMRNITKGYLCPNSTSDFESYRGLIKLIRLSFFNFTYLSGIVSCMSLVGILWLLISKTLWNQKGLGNNEEKNIQKKEQNWEQKKRAQKKRDRNQTYERAQGERTSGVQRAA